MNKLRNENKINKATPEKSSSPSTWSAPGKGNCDGCPPAGKENRCIWAPKTVGGTTRRRSSPAPPFSIQSKFTSSSQPPESWLPWPMELPGKWGIGEDRAPYPPRAAAGTGRRGGRDMGGACRGATSSRLVRELGGSSWGRTLFAGNCTGRRGKGNAERANSRMASDVGCPGIESGGGGMKSDQTWRVSWRGCWRPFFS